MSRLITSGPGTVQANVDGRWLTVGHVADGKGELAMDAWGADEFRVIPREFQFHACTPIPFPTTPQTVSLLAGLVR